MSGTTTGGGPPHNPTQNPPPAGVTLEQVLESFEHLKALLLAYAAESRTPAEPPKPEDDGA